MRILFNICWFSLVFLVALSCNETAEVGTVAEEEFFVPNVFLQEGDSLLMFDTTGVLLYKESPFSGYLLAENNIERVKTMTPFINGLKEGLVIGHYPDSSICLERV